MNDVTAPHPAQRGLLRLGIAALAAAAALLGPAVASDSASAAACSSATSQSTCVVGTSTTVTGGALGLSAPSTLYWSFVQSGYDQIESGSSTQLTSCAASGTATSCSSGTLPVLRVTDATGAGSGWALSAYISGSDLPAGTAVVFNGAGTSAGASVNGSAITATSPTGVCDFNSTCTTPSTATTCAHAALGFTSCPAYGVAIPTSSGGAAAQVDLYSAAASTGLGAICFGSGTATAASCAGTTSTGLFNMKMPPTATARTYTGAVVNLTAVSGP